MVKPHPSAAAPTDLDALLDEIIAEVSERIRGGESIDIEQYAERHPEIAAQLRQLCPAMEAMANLGFEPDEALRPAEPNAPEETKQLGTLGDFRLLREIGRGGMGVVYEAQQISLNRNVALKILPFAAMLDDRHIQRFKNEALAAAQLDHPHIVDVYGVGCERSVHYYAMRYVEGTTLADVIRELRDKQPPAHGETAQSHRQEEPPSQPERKGAGADEPLPDPPAQANIDTDALAAITTNLSADSRRFINAAARIGIEVAEALDHAHEHGVIHRDIKPGNILLDHNTKTWVTDFGLARVEADPSMTMTGDLLGTIRYMSPEQAMAKRVIVDHRTDVYSLGVTLYELVTMQPAFPDNDRQELMRKIAFEEPPLPRKLNRAIPEELETIILKASAKNPAERYATAAELAEDLRCFLDNKPIQARRPTALQRLTKWSQRHRAAVLTTGLAASLLLCFGIIVLAISNQLISQERDAKQDALAAATQNLEQAERETNRAERAEALAKQRLELEQKAREQLSAERDKAVQAESAAESRFQLATEAVERYLEEVANDPELQAGNFHELRKRLLESAMPFYEKLIAEKPQNQNQRIARGKAFEGLWRLEHYYFSNYDAGLSHAKQAFEVFEQLAEETPDDGEIRRELAGSHTVMGIAIEAAGGEAQDARQHFEQAIGIAQTLVKEFPDEVKFQSLLANTTGNWANKVGSEQEREQLREKSVILYQQLSDKFPEKPEYRDKIAFYLNNSSELPKLQRALEIREQLHRDHPHVTKYRDHVAVSFRTVAERYRRDGQWDRSREHYEKALELRAALALEFAVPNHKYELALIHRGLGVLFQNTSNPEQAREHYDQATAILEALVNELKDVTQFRSQLSLVLCDLGKDRYRTGKWQTALELFQKADQLKDGELNLHRFYIAMAYWQLGDHEQARTHYWDAVTKTRVGDGWEALHGPRSEAEALLGISREARLKYLGQLFTEKIETEPDNENHYLSRGATYRDLGEYQKSLADCNRALEINPEYYDALLRRATVYRYLEDHEAAAVDAVNGIKRDLVRGWGWNELTRIVRAAKNPEVLSAIDELEQALEEDASLIASRAESLSTIYQLRSTLYVNTGQLDKATEECSKAVRTTPDSHHAYLNRARCHQAGGDLQSAMADFDHALELAEVVEKWSVLRARAHVQWGVGHFKKAIADVSAAIELNPDDYKLCRERALYHLDLGDSAAALADMNHAIAMNPEAGECYHRRARALIGLERFEEAVADCDHVLRSAPEDSAALVSRSRANLALDKYQATIRDVVSAIRLGRDEDWVWGRLGTAIYFAEDAADLAAIDDLEKYLEANKEKLSAHADSLAYIFLTRAALHEREGNAEQASADREKAIHVAADPATAFRKISWLHVVKEEWNEARAAYAQVLEFAPESFTAHTWLGYVRLLEGDVDGYRQHCRDLLDRYDETGSGSIADAVMESMPTQPWSPEELQKPLAVAQRVANKTDADHWDQSRYGAMLFRAGRYEEALTRLAEVRRELGDKTHGKTLYFLAMTHHALGNTEQARQCTEQAEKWLSTRDPKSSAIVLLLQAEAKQLLATAKESD